jgi:hypothetical protein
MQRQSDQCVYDWVEGRVRSLACGVAVLDTSYADLSGGAGGLDVYVWGYNGDYELHSGSRANLPNPKPARCAHTHAHTHTHRG